MSLTLSTPDPPRTPRTIQIDALRAFAFLAVLLEHYGGVLNSYVPLGGGVLGVGLFFVISGFLITSLLLKSIDAYGSRIGFALANFYARRFLRLAPPFYLTLLVLTALHVEPIASSWLWHAGYLTNFWIIAGHPSNVFWSLAVEEQFYLFWPVVLLLTDRRQVLAVAASAIAVGLLFKLAACLIFNLRPLDVTFLLPSDLGLLGIGAVLAILSYRDNAIFQFSWYTRKVRRALGTLAVLGLAAATVIWRIDGPDHAISFLTTEALVGPAFAWLVIGAAQGCTGLPGWLMNNPAILYVGRISYSLYLVHNFVPKLILQITGELPRPVWLVLSLAVTFGVASLSWFFIEKPLLRLKRFFPDSQSRGEGNWVLSSKSSSS